MGEDNLKALRAQLGSAFTARASRHGTASLMVKVVLIIGGTLLVGVAQSVTLPSTGPWPFWNVVGLAATALVAIGGLFVTFTDKDAGHEMDLARRAADAATELESELESVLYVLQDARRSTELYGAMKAMRDVVEQSLFNPYVETAAVKAMLELAQRSLMLAFDFRLENHWTVCIYKAIPDHGGKTLLECIAHLRSIDCDIAKARKWPEGVGVAGIGYARSSEVIVPDLMAKELGTIHDVVTRAKPDDMSRYRSIIAVPILLGTDNLRWGMVVATSDQPGHFSLEQEPGVRTSEAARAVAAMIALLLSANRNRSAQPSSPTGP